MDKKPLPPIAINIRKRRKAIPKLSAQKLADYLDCDVQTVYSWESGARRPSNEHREKMARFFGCTEAELLGEAPDSNSSTGVAVLGSLTSGAEVLRDPTLGYIEPFLRHPEATDAILVNDDTNSPSFVPGAALYLKLLNYIPASSFGKSCLIETLDNRFFIRLLEGIGKNGYIIRRIDNLQTEEIDLKSASPILNIESKRRTN